jgi:hypothetical protein
MAYMDVPLVRELEGIGFDWRAIAGLRKMGVRKRSDLSVVREEDLLSLSVDELVGWSVIRVRQVVRYWQEGLWIDRPIWPSEWESDPSAPQSLHGGAKN